MLSRGLVAVVVVVVVMACLTTVSAKALPDQDMQVQPHALLDPYGNHLVDDDGSLDAALLNYLFAKKLVERMRSNADMKDLESKRSYWKQCAFNAVSCFGKRK